MAVIPKRPVIDNIHDTITSGYIDNFDNINNQSGVLSGGTLVRNFGAKNLFALIRVGAGLGSFEARAKAGSRVTEIGRGYEQYQPITTELNDGQLMIIQVPEEFNDENGYYQIVANNSDQIKMQVFRLRE